MDKKHNLLRLPRHTGFTLVELLIALAIATILVTAAVPGFSTIIQNNRVTTQANEFLTALSLARSEALKRGRNVTLTADTAGQWQDGWTISDNFGNALYVNEGFEGNSTLTNADGANSITFNSRGFLTTGAQSVFNLTVTDAPTGRSITVSPSGSSSIEKTES